MRARKTCAAIGAAALFMLLASAPERGSAADAVRLSLSVDAARVAPPISPNLHGQFVEHLGHSVYGGIWVGRDSAIANTGGVRRDVLAAVKALQVPTIRWPGGCFADSYDWHDGIGPAAERPVRLNRMWGGIESNDFGTHEFLDFAEQVGADSYVSINVGSLSPHDAAQWIEYMTASADTALTRERRSNGRAAPWRVGHVGIGNELWGCGGNLDAAGVASATKRYSYFLSGPDDHPFRRVASGPGFDHPDPEGLVDTLMRNRMDFYGKPVFDAMSIHYYAVPFASDYPKQPQGLTPRLAWMRYVHDALGIEAFISRIERVMDRTDRKKEVAIYVDEWGAMHTEAPGFDLKEFDQPASFLDAEVAAITLNALQRHSDRVRMANLSQMVNVGQSILKTRGAAMIMTPTYHVFNLYRPFRGSVPVQVTLSPATTSFDGVSVPMVDAFAARSRDGRLHVALVNLDPERGGEVATSLSGRATGEILSAHTLEDANSFAKPDTVRPLPYEGARMRGGKLRLSLPPRSIVVVAIDERDR